MYKSKYEYNKEYAKKYLAKQAEIKVRMTPEEKHEIEEKAAAAGLSVNMFIRNAVSGYQPETPVYMAEVYITGQDVPVMVNFLNARIEDGLFVACDVSGTSIEVPTGDIIKINFLPKEKWGLRN